MDPIACRDIMVVVMGAWHQESLCGPEWCQMCGQVPQGDYNAGLPSTVHYADPVHVLPVAHQFWLSPAEEESPLLPTTYFWTGHKGVVLLQGHAFRTLMILGEPPLLYSSLVLSSNNRLYG